MNANAADSVYATWRVKVTDPMLGDEVVQDFGNRDRAAGYAAGLRAAIYRYEPRADQTRVLLETLDADYNVTESKEII